jgi:hypothetical protein
VAREAEPVGNATATGEPGNGRIRFGKGQPPHYCGKPGRSGPPLGNVNGLKSGRYSLKAGKLPKAAAYIEIRLNQFRRELEAAVVEAKGTISLPDASVPGTATRSQQDDWSGRDLLLGARVRDAAVEGIRLCCGQRSGAVTPRFGGNSHPPEPVAVFDPDG